MITIGLLFIIDQIITSIWGFDALNLGDPWGVDTIKMRRRRRWPCKDLWTIGLAARVLAGFFALLPLLDAAASRCARPAFDQEAALAQGISARRVFALSWAIAGASPRSPGVTLASGPGGAARRAIGAIALVAFPAMILGGLDSPAGRGPRRADHRPHPDAHRRLPGRPRARGSGDDFQAVMPYVVMILILLVRPYGLFGTPEVRSV